MGVSEPRYRQASELLRRLGFETHDINWARTREDLKKFEGGLQNLFRLNTRYGAGILNCFMHFRFNIFILRRIWVIKPKVLYVCDFDTLLPSIVYRAFNPAILIFDQFDPLSARITNKHIGSALDMLENLFAKQSDIRITANLQRVSEKARSSWIEIKNLIALNTLKEEHRKEQNVFQLFYGGILTHDRGLLHCIDIIETKKTWRVNIFGEGPERSSLEKRVGSNISLHHQVPHSELMIRARAANLYLAQYDPCSRNNRLTASNKLYEAAQLRIPLLTSKNTYIGEIVQKFKLGWAVTYGDSEEFEAALDECASMTETQRVGLVDNLTRFLQDEIDAQNSNIERLEHRIISMIRSEGK
jgi:glycosyltransferase involved in cell wall biosynthesis